MSVELSSDPNTQTSTSQASLSVFGVDVFSGNQQLGLLLLEACPQIDDLQAYKIIIVIHPNLLLIELFVDLAYLPGISKLGPVCGKTVLWICF